jgi:hypothetical protein
MKKSELIKRLRDTNNPQILEALDKGWEPPTLEDAINCWEDNARSDPDEHIAGILSLAVEHIPDAELLDELRWYFEADAVVFLSKDKQEGEDIAVLGWGPDEEKESDQQKQFRKDMEKADREFEFYRGRFYYRGWATRADDFNDLQDVIRATKVGLQWDQLGKEGYIVYPQD